MIRISAFLLVAGLALPVTCHGEESSSSPLLVIGIDGGSWRAIEPLIDSGRLPHLARIKTEGAWGEMRAVPPLISPALWTEAATGRPRSEHGLIDFEISGSRVASSARRVKAIWNILSEEGRKVLIVGLLGTWPAEKVKGVIISDQALNKAIDRRAHPPEALSGFGPFPAWNFTHPQQAWRLRRLLPGGSPREGDRQLAWMFLRDESLLRAAEHHLRRLRPSLFWFHLWGVDYASHFHWNDPEFLARYYEFADEAVGRLSRAADSGATVIVLSDHGFEGYVPQDGDPNPRATGRHSTDGILLARGPGIRPCSGVKASLFDMVPTLLYLQGLPVSQEMPGRVLYEMLAGDPPKAEIIASYESNRRPPETVPSAALGEEERRLLRALGYLK
ncbi:MAG: alkaline phosphatase family protein [Elusimicrobia bacterium]|nr:alkaline phosphatase family protein [Elusimicrobiota bacterium]